MGTVTRNGLRHLTLSWRRLSWLTGFYMITASVMKGLRLILRSTNERNRSLNFRCIYVDSFLYAHLPFSCRSVSLPWKKFPQLHLPMKCQCWPHIETRQLTCCVNQLTGFYMRATLALNGFILEAKFGDDPLTTATDSKSQGWESKFSFLINLTTRRNI